MKRSPVTVSSFLAVLIIPLLCGFSWFNENGTSKENKEAAPSNVQTNINSRKPAALSQDSKSNTTMNAKRETSSPAVPRKQELAPAALPQGSGGTASPVKEIQGLNQTLKSLQATSAAKSQQSAAQSARMANQRILNAKNDLEVARIQKQINEIIEVNEKFKGQEEEQLEQIRKITEQAQIHRKMLEKLEQKKSDSEQVSVDDMDEVVRQEKLRLIQQETERNRNYVNRLANQSPNAGVS